ncbi:MAG: glycoside hydrolase family 3 C-terminal domain-containing protein [Opitutales bacterium]
MKPLLACALIGSLFFGPMLPAQNTSTPPATAPAAQPLYLDPTQPVSARVDDLLSRLTTEEKVALLHADGTFSTAAIPRLGLPERWMLDGPNGVREEIERNGWNSAGRTDDFSTCFPSGICLAATWSPDVARGEGAAIGEEARARGKDIMLGPAVNIERIPLNGRSFEYFGEDPWLAGRIAVAFIQGEQSQDIASCVKHFAANNQETNRNSIDVNMDERTLREIYLPAFEAAVKEGGVLSVMAAYNKFRGEYCAQNDYLLNQILKKDWGFQGLVMTDWGAAHDTKALAYGGLDLEMGTHVAADVDYDTYYLAQPFLDGVNSGQYPMALLNDKARRNLYVMIASHVLDQRPAGSINTAAHQAMARRVAEEGMVLLKNDQNALPLDPAQIKSIAVIGDNATRLQAAGGESSGIKAFYEISPLAGILNRVGNRVNVTFSQGYLAPSPGRNRARTNAGADTSGNTTLIANAVAAAKQADVAIVVCGLNKNFDTEGRDRPDLKLPFNQDDLIQSIVAANPRTIVVLVAGSPVEMGPWLQKVPAVLLAWYGGSEAGNALARILFGDVNPSGKLPCTFPKQLADTPAAAFGPEAYPGVNGEETYKEGLLVGYRWYDTKNIEPLFPFGHGLSYTTFQYSNLKLLPGDESKGIWATVQFDVTNTGAREGEEVAQVYVRQAKPSLPRPDKELKGFYKLPLQPGETETVAIPLGQRAFAYYDPDKKGWLAEAGDFQILVGSSSRDLRLDGTFKLADTSIYQ